MQEAVSFSHHQVLGELKCACVACRLDISHAVTLLSRFASAPHEEHCKALCGICKCLRRTKDWGLVCWHRSPVESLPDAPLHSLPIDSALPEFPAMDLLKLIGFVDAAHAADIKTRRSVTGLAFCLAGTAIACKSKLQATVATLSTEAEFIAAVHAGKTAKYLRSVLADLGFPQNGPTPLCKDNQAAIAMINECKPAPRSRHIDIQHFAIQEWRQRGILHMRHIPGVINPADHVTKSLGWTLFSQHARRSMGHCRPW